MAVDAQRAITLGHPSYVWRSGQDRRLRLIRKFAPLDGRAILDIGCGLGMYVRRFRSFSPRVYGMDVDAPRVREGAHAGLPNLFVAAGEHLPLKSESLDVIVLNEVIEHVGNDRDTLREAVRALRPGGRIVVFAPNRLWPFETHGVYLGRRYVFGNIPLVNYLPNALRNRLAPHARVYTTRGIRRITHGLDAEIIEHGYVFPGFDNVAARRPLLARVIRAVLYTLENTPLRTFGLSHLLVLERRPATVPEARQ